MKLEENFHLKEFMCRDGTPVPDYLIENVKKLAKNLQVLRNYVQRPIIVISGYRTKKYNTKIKGARRSQHLLAKAADIKIPGLQPSTVKDIIVSLIKSGHMDSGGIGLYTTFTHYDIRGRNARWLGKGVKDDS